METVIYICCHGGMVLEIGSRQRGHGCDVWGWLDMESWEMALKAGWEVEPNAAMTWHERSWQIMKAWNEPGRRKTVLAMNFHPLFLPEPANNDLKNWYTIFFRGRWIPMLPKRKTPLGLTKSFHIVLWIDRMQPSTTMHRYGKIIRLVPLALEQRTKTPSRRPRKMTQWPGCLGFCFFFIFHGLILNTDKCALFQLLPRCDDKGTSVVTSQVDMSRLMTLKTNEKMVYGLCMFTSMLFMLFMFHMLPSESVFKWPMHWAREAYSQLKVKRVKLVVDQMAAIFSLPATWRNVLSLLLS